MVTDFRCCHAVLFYNYRRQNKFIRLACFIGIPDCLHRIGRSGSSAKHHGVICLLHTLPAFISVHGIISAHYGCNFAYADFAHFFLQLCGIFRTGGRRGISAVQKNMHINLLQIVSFCQLQQSVQVGIVAMHTAVGKQTIQMQCGIVFLTMLHRLQQCGIFKEIAVLNRLCDTCQLLINDTPCAHIQMPNLRISHLPCRQTNVQTAGIALDEGIFLHQSVQNRGLCQLYGIALCFIIQTEAIQNHQNCCFFLHFFLHSSRNPLPEPQGV